MEEVGGATPRVPGSLNKSMLLCPVGLAEVGVEKGAWWPGAVQQDGLCGGHCREAGKTFWELPSEPLADLLSKPGVVGQSSMLCWNTGAPLSSRDVQAQR